MLGLFSQSTASGSLGSTQMRLWETEEGDILLLFEFFHMQIIQNPSRPICELYTHSDCTFTGCYSYIIVFVILLVY